MANRRDTFAKRQREADLKEKARAKAARRVAKKTEPRATKGPEIAWGEEFVADSSGSAGLGPDQESPDDQGDDAPADSADNSNGADNAAPAPPAYAATPRSTSRPS